MFVGTLIPMISERLRASFAARLAAFFLAVLFFAFFSKEMLRGVHAASGGTEHEGELLAHACAWSVWLGLMWMTFALRARLLPRVGERPLTRIFVEVSLCLAYAQISVDAPLRLVSHFFGPPPGPGGLSIEVFRPMMFLRGVAMYSLVSLVRAVVAAERRRRRSETEARELAIQREGLQRRLDAARLATLRAQLHPHFLFNALHAIGGLILQEDPRTAQRALASLSSLLRRSLEHADGHLGTLDQEVAMLRKYVELEQLRFGERLKVTFDVPSDLGASMVPTLLLMPLVQNAVAHGLEPKPGGGKVTISARRADESLVLEVVDDGIGRARAAERSSSSTGTGLITTSERLRALYGDQASLSVEDVQPSGTHLTVTLPISDAPAPMVLTENAA